MGKISTTCTISVLRSDRKRQYISCFPKYFQHVAKRSQKCWKWYRVTRSTNTLPMYLNSLRSRGSYMRHQTKPSLFQIMACHLTSTKPSAEPCWNSVDWTPGNNFQLNFNQNTTFFIQENVFENMSSGKWRPFCLGLNVIIELVMSQLMFGMPTQNTWTTKQNIGMGLASINPS